MMQCLCGIYAINHHLHGRLAGKYEDMCDVCYWRISHKALQYLNAELLKALVEVTASLAWNAHGECRAIHDGPIMPSSGAVEMGKAAIAKARSQA